MHTSSSQDFQEVYDDGVTFVMTVRRIEDCDVNIYDDYVSSLEHENSMLTRRVYELEKRLTAVEDTLQRVEDALIMSGLDYVPF